MGQESTPSLGSWIRASRKEVGWTQAELSRLLEVSQGTVSHWEKGRVVPGEAHRAKLEELFGGAPAQLQIPLDEVSGKPPEPPKPVPEKSSKRATKSDLSEIARMARTFSPSAVEQLRSYLAAKEREFEELKRSLRENEQELQKQDSAPIVRSIEFPPEYRDAGVAVLSYFATYVEHKYRNEEITLQIEQKGPRVTLRIRTAAGREEIIERALEEYGMTVTGRLAMEEVLPDPVHIVELRNQLRIARAMLESNRDIMALKDAEGEKKDAMISRFVDIIEKGISRQPVSKTVILAEASAIAESQSSSFLSIDARIPVIAIQGALKELAERLPIGSAERTEIQGVDQALESVVNEVDAEKVSKSSAFSKLRRLVQDLGDEKSALGKSVRGLREFARIFKTIVDEAGNLASALGLPIEWLS